VRFSFDPGVILSLLLFTSLYARAVAVLARRGYAVPGLQQLAGYSGLALTAIGLLSPVDSLGEELLSAHMAQHLLIADLAAPLLLIGIRTPVVVFLLPRPVLVPLARNHSLRRAFRFVRKPLVAIPIWVVALYGWHLEAMFEGALHNGLLHALQHESFVVASLLVWWPVIDPKRRHTTGELWKAGHVIGARLAGMFLGMAFLIMLRTPVYDAYGDSALAYGLTPLQDQQLAGAMMMGLDLMIMLGTLAFFFWAAERDTPRGTAPAPG
jgi:putative membrane protein